MDQSIHPRVINGRTMHSKSSTSRSPDKAVTKRKMDAISEHLERHPHDKASQQHLDKLARR